jgi:NDP-sugar pyrophosphorylase family protein
VGVTGSEVTLLPVAILAGGLATRLRPLSEKIPKSLIEVNGEPFVAHQLRLLRAHCILRVVLCVGHLGELVQQEIGDGRAWRIQVEYSFDGAVPLGTAGAIRQALPRLGEEFFVLYGDSYLACDYGAVVQAFTAAGKLALMTVFRNDGKWDSSNVEFHQGRIVAYSKKDRNPRMHYIDYGLGVFRAEAFASLAPGQAYDLAELYRDLLRSGQLAGFEVSQRFYEIGTPAGLKETEEFLKARPATI